MSLENVHQKPPPSAVSAKDLKGEELSHNSLSQSHMEGMTYAHASEQFWSEVARVGQEIASEFFPDKGSVVIENNSLFLMYSTSTSDGRPFLKIPLIELVVSIEENPPKFSIKTGTNELGVDLPKRSSIAAAAYQLITAAKDIPFRYDPFIDNPSLIQMMDPVQLEVMELSRLPLHTLIAELIKRAKPGDFVPCLDPALPGRFHKSGWNYLGQSLEYGPWKLIVLWRDSERLEPGHIFFLTDIRDTSITDRAYVSGKVGNYWKPSNGEQVISDECASLFRQEIREAQLLEAKLIIQNFAEYLTSSNLVYHDKKRRYVDLPGLNHEAISFRAHHDYRFEVHLSEGGQKVLEIAVNRTFDTKWGEREVTILKVSDDVRLLQDVTHVLNEQFNPAAHDKTAQLVARFKPGGGTPSAKTRPEELPASEQNSLSRFWAYCRSLLVRR
jgi:hypothetical protein